MTFSYDPNLASELDQMRHALGDIVAPGTDPDETYDAQLVTMGGSWRRAAAAIARSFAARRITKPTSFTDVGIMSVGWSDPASAWLKLAASLEAAAQEEESPVTGDGTLYFTAPTRPDLVADDAEYSAGLRGWR